MQGVLGFIGSARVTLADMVTGFGGNANSINVVPVFTSASDLHLNDAALNNLGTPIASVTTDIDGDVRSTITPDMGADEFCITPIAPIAIPQAFCGGAMVTDLTTTSGTNIKWYDDLTQITH